MFRHMVWVHLAVLPLLRMAVVRSMVGHQTRTVVWVRARRQILMQWVEQAERLLRLELEVGLLEARHPRPGVDGRREAKHLRLDGARLGAKLLDGRAVVGRQHQEREVRLLVGGHLVGQELAVWEARLLIHTLLPRVGEHLRLMHMLILDHHG